MMTNTAAENTMPTTTARAIKRLKDILPVKNSPTRMAKTSVSTMAANNIAFFLFIFQLL